MTATVGPDARPGRCLTEAVSPSLNLSMNQQSCRRSLEALLTSELDEQQKRRCTPLLSTKPPGLDGRLDPRPTTPSDELQQPAAHVGRTAASVSDGNLARDGGLLLQV
jgi:hypothetical protein